MGIAPVSLYDCSRCSFIWGTVIQQNQLEILVRLIQNALNALLQKPSVVVIRNNNTDTRSHIINGNENVNENEKGGRS